jgi:hypothetical protein
MEHRGKEDAMKIRAVWVMFVALVAAHASSTFASQGALPEDYGVGDTNELWVNASEFSCSNQVFCSWTHWTAGFWYNTGTTTEHLQAQVQLPSGALITGLRIAYFDITDVTGEQLSVQLQRFWVRVGAAGQANIGSQWVSPDSADATVVYHDIDPDHTVKYYLGPPLMIRQSYALDLYASPTTEVALRGVIVLWKRQISPAPAVATFDDVPVGAFGFRHVEALAASGITAGCDATHFCPNDPLTRVQMAVFLAKALGLHWAP